MSDLQTEIEKEFHNVWLTGPAARSMILFHSASDVENVRLLCLESFIAGEMDMVRRANNMKPTLEVKR